MNLSNANSILAVEETKILGPVLDLIETTGACVTRVGNVEEALTAIERNGIEIALVDMYVPKGGGMYLLSLLKRVRPKLPVIVFFPKSDRLYPECIVDLGMLGATNVIVAPYEADKVLEAVEAALVLQRYRP